MAIKALKSAGVAAYQGSSPNPAVSAAEQPVVKPEVPVAKGNSGGIMEKVVNLTTKRPEKKPSVRREEDRTGSRVQEHTTGKDALKVTESVLPEVREQVEGKLPMEALKRTIEELNRQAVNSEAVFGVHDTTNRLTIKIVDKETREVIKEYPPEKTLDMIAKVWEQAGLLVDEKG